MIPYVLTRKLVWNSGTPQPQMEDIYNPAEEGHWRYMLHRKYGMNFYLGFHFLPEIQSFVIYTVYATTQMIASTFKVEMFVEEEDAANPQRLCHETRVFSVENLGDLLDPNLSPNYFWILPVETIRKFFKFRRNEDSDSFTVSIPLYVKMVTKHTNDG